jgi:tetratricopeptide (TPR) repeat protein
MNGIHSAARMQATGQNGSSRHGGDLISAVTTATIVSRPARGAADAALGFSHMLPVSLLPLAVTLTAIAIDGLRAQASDDPAATPALAGWLGNLAYRLNADGRREEALETATEGAALYRQLADGSPAAHLPDLATSLSNLAALLRDVGRREEALQTATEAAAIRRQLAEASPAAHLPDLAGSLSNLANALSDVGRREEALQTAAEAAALHRQLAEASPPPTVRTWPRRRLSAARVLHPGGTVTYPGLSVTRRQRGFTQFTRPVFPLPAAQGRRKDCFGFFPGLRTRASRTRARTPGRGRALSTSPGLRR